MLLTFRMKIAVLITVLQVFILVTCEDVSCHENIEPVVETNTGMIAGKCVKILDTEVSSFLGIPFAEPPVGEKRFSRIDPISNWKGILLAKEKPPSCMQFSSRNFSWIPSSVNFNEDCLYLNVWVPNKCCNKSEKLPVMVWIHGGGYYSGSSSMDVYDGSVLASLGKVIVVSINYRLGLFGFFNGGISEAPGNVGLHDQILALQWINANIEKFGGDSKRITLFGQSAGAMAISLHLVSPLSQGLFSRAILQSGSAYHPHLNDDINVSLFKSNKLAEVIGCSNAEENLLARPSEVISCLKTKNASELAQIENIFTSKFPLYFAPYFGNKCEGCNDILPESPIKMMNAKKELETPTVIGINENEGFIFLSYIMSDIFSEKRPVQLSLFLAKEIIKGLFSTAPEIPPEAVFDFYFRDLKDNTPDVVKSISNAFGDYVFVCPAMFLAEKTESFTYWLTHNSNSKESNQKWMGISHFAEVPYVFGEPLLTQEKYSNDDKTFSTKIIQKWTDFSRNGFFKDESLAWSKFTKNHPLTHELNFSSGENSLITFPRLEACEFWRPYFERQSN